MRETGKKRRREEGTERQGLTSPEKRLIFSDSPPVMSQGWVSKTGESK